MYKRQLIANKKFMDKLPADLRKVVVDAAHKAIMAQRASLEKEEAAFKAVSYTHLDVYKRQAW